MLHATKLHAEHQELGATLVDFGGWDMPLWYPTGAVKEHLAVINGAGLFDIGHMGGLLLTGPGGHTALQWAFTKDMEQNGNRAVYGAFLTPEGFVIDDAITYPLGNDRYFVVMNCGKCEAIISAIQHAAKVKQVDITIQDLAGTYTKIDLQGMASVRIMAAVLQNPDDVFGKMPYFSFKGDIDLPKSNVLLADGTPIFLSRTGYTGEQGFEIFVPADASVKVWKKLLEVGKPFGLMPCGLAARDSLRAGAMLPLSGQDIGPWPFVNNVWPFTLPKDADGAWTKSFEGQKALDAAAPTAPHTFAYCGFDPRKVTSADHHTHPKVLLDGKEIGDVLTCVADVAIGRVDGKIFSMASPDKPEGFTTKGLVCGFVRVNCVLEPGTRITLADERRKIEVEITTDVRPARTARKALVYKD